MNSHVEVIDNTNDLDPVSDCDTTLLCDSSGTASPERTSVLDSAYRAIRSVSATSNRFGAFRQFVVNKTNVWFFVGSVLLIFGAALYMNAISSDDSGVFNLSLILIFGGGIFVWVPIFYWMSEPVDPTDSSADQEAPHPSPPVHVPRDKPPDYETLTPLDNPPPYEEVNFVGDYLQPPTSFPNSTDVNIEIPGVHQLAVEHRGNMDNTRVQQARSNGRGITRRRSTGDLHCTDRDRDHVQL